MVANPMQKKARNSFLLGMVITLVVCILIGVLFYVLIIQKEKKKEEERGEEVQAYVLNTNVMSGQVITSDLLTPITVYENMVPQNYIDVSLLNIMQLQDNNGNALKTALVEKDGIKETKLYIDVNENKDYVSVTEKTNDKNKVLIEIDENGYYKTRKGQGKEYIQLNQAPAIAKIDMYMNSIVTSDSVARGNLVENDLRYVEYNMLVLPTTAEVGSYIDIRLTLPNGQDLIVVSKKEIKSILGDTIGLELSEGEITMMESAIVESYIMTASKLYAIQYVEPGMQTAAIKTYTPTDAVKGLIERNPNIVQNAKKGLLERFNVEIRAWADFEKNKYELEEQQQNLETGIKEEIENAKAAREAYLNGLTSY